jgi:putative ABC transport system permease protein
LTEALILSLIGGLIGVAIGIGCVFILPLFTSISAVLSTFYVLLPFSFSGIVGLLFGFIPAYKASLLNPINALRYE